MNWTEGSLARHARRTGWNEGATKQKEYFAKARSRQRHNSQTAIADASEFVPSYMVDKSQARNRPDASNSHQRDAHIWRLNPEDSRHTNSNYNNSGTESVSYPKRRATDLHDASLSTQAEEYLDAKRARLLETSDWSGVGIQKPLVVTYPSDSTVIKSSKKHHTDPSHRGSRQRCAAIALAPSPDNTAHGQTLDNVVIRIGSQDYRWSPAANTIKAASLQDWRQKERVGYPIPASHDAVECRSPTSLSMSSSLTESPCVRQSLLNTHLKDNLSLSRQPVKRQPTPSTVDGARYVVISSLETLYRPKATKPKPALPLKVHSSSSIAENSTRICFDQAKLLDSGPLCALSSGTAATENGAHDDSHSGQGFSQDHNDTSGIIDSLSHVHAASMPEVRLTPDFYGEKISSASVNLRHSPVLVSTTTLSLVNEPFSENLDQSLQREIGYYGWVEENIQLRASYRHDDTSILSESDETIAPENKLGNVTEDISYDEDAIWREFVFGSSHQMYGKEGSQHESRVLDQHGS